MKLRLSLLLNASIIASAPLVVSAQGKSETKQSKTTQEILAHDSDVYSAKPLERPNYDDYDDVDSYGLYWDTEAFKTHYDMTFAYRILKKLIGVNDQKLEKLPYKEKLENLIPTLGSEFENIYSSYLFATHNELWKLFIKLWEEVNFNYGSYLKEQYKSKHNDSNDKITDDLKNSTTYGIFISKSNDIFQVRTMVAHFEAINLFIKHKNNPDIKALILQLFKVERGANTADPAYKNTLDDSLPILEKIREKAGEDLVSDIAKQVEQEYRHDKLMHDALLSARRAFGSTEYNEKIKPLVKQVFETSDDEFLKSLKEKADSIYLGEKQKVNAVFEELKDSDKEKKFKERIDNARNVGLLRDVYADLVTEKIKQVQEEVKISIDKTKGSNDYNDFNSRFAAIKEKNDKTVNQKKAYKDAFEQKWRDFGANKSGVKINIKDEKDSQRAKLDAQLKEQELTLVQLETIKQEAENLYDEETKLTQQAIEAINSETEKTKKLEEFKNAKDIEALKKIALEAKKIKDAEDLAKAKQDAQKAVESTVGSQKHDEYKQKLTDAKDDISKLNELITLASGEYNNKRKEVEENLKGLDDKKDFDKLFEAADNIQKLDELNLMISAERKAQTLAKAQKRASKAVQSTLGSDEYAEFSKMLQESNQDADKLNVLAQKAEQLYDNHKQKVEDIYKQLFDKKDFRARIDNATNIEMLDNLLPIITKENFEQQNAHIKQEAKDSVEKLQGSEQYDNLKQQLNNNPDDLDRLKELTKQAKEEFEKESNEVQKEIDKLDDNNAQKQQIAQKLKDAQNVGSLRKLKLQALNAYQAQEKQKADKQKEQEQKKKQQEKQDSSTKTMKKAKKKTNVAAIVAPLVIVPLALVGGGVLSWALVRRHRNKNNK
ncbi:hypothetical protein E1I18_00700 [Mycoplasmopsis mucosicanis]|uniref:Uncharacterized protein n=1 Tax=Mycoplasmopsis mucosicanis TaxID=458208 RepID=A0A507SQN9_9BACT|nr:hypothetical protein [Mycoplasmopsis mucosicanis]TQC54109.1 hypothetical protein E1I18_00700 [Mycoplasmopsis mucosicanis]